MHSHARACSDTHSISTHTAVREHLDRAFVIMIGAVFAETVVPKLLGEGLRQVGHDCFDRVLVLILSSNDVGQQLFDLSSRRHATATAVRLRARQRRAQTRSLKPPRCNCKETAEKGQHLRGERNRFAGVEVLNEVVLNVVLQQLLLDLDEQVCELELQFFAVVVCAGLLA